LPRTDYWSGRSRHCWKHEGLSILSQLGDFVLLIPRYRLQSCPSSSVLHHLNSATGVTDPDSIQFSVSRCWAPKYSHPIKHQLCTRSHLRFSVSAFSSASVIFFGFLLVCAYLVVVSRVYAYLTAVGVTRASADMKKETRHPINVTQQLI
jgi:hypothetical protein